MRKNNMVDFSYLSNCLLFYNKKSIPLQNYSSYKKREILLNYNINLKKKGENFKLGLKFHFTAIQI